MQTIDKAGKWSKGRVERGMNSWGIYAKVCILCHLSFVIEENINDIKLFCNYKVNLLTFPQVPKGSTSSLSFF